MRSPRSTHAVALGCACRPRTGHRGRDERPAQSRRPRSVRGAGSRDTRFAIARRTRRRRRPSAAGSPAVLVIRMPQYRSGGGGIDLGDAVIGAGGADGRGRLALEELQHGLLERALDGGRVAVAGLAGGAHEAVVDRLAVAVAVEDARVDVGGPRDGRRVAQVVGDLRWRA